VNWQFHNQGKPNAQNEPRHDEKERRNIWPKGKRINPRLPTIIQVGKRGTERMGLLGQMAKEAFQEKETAVH